MKTNEYASQPRRLVYLIVYVLLFMWISNHLFESAIPPLTEKGFWFYTGLVSLIIGSLLVTPNYTSPANGLSYATAGLIALLYTKPNEIAFGYQITLSILILIISLSLLSIATFKSQNITLQNFSFSSKIFVENFGNPQILYLILLIYAIFQFHNDSIKESVWIFIAGIIAFLRLVELVDNTRARIWNHWRLKKNLLAVGKIEAYQSPNLILIRLEKGLTIGKNSILMVKDSTFGIKLGFNLGYMGRDENILLRVLELAADNPLESSNQDFSKGIVDNEVFVISDELVKELTEKNEIIKKAKDFLGIIDTESSLDNISIEIINEGEIAEGSLLEVKIKNDYVIYQVLEGLTWEDIVAQKNKYGYSKAKARKIGKWNNEEKKFEVVKWMPQINSPVFFKRKDEMEIPIEAIGTFPETNYYVSIKDMNSLVTHNTAILGILGVGKTFLALELCERMIAEEIKIIAIDLTNQYENELTGFYIPAQLEFNTNELQRIGAAGRTNYQQTKEEGGSINQFRQKVEEQLRTYLNQDEIFLTIYNPLRFEVWKQSGGMFNETAAMASLTPCEVTQIITESTLNICHELGMAENARVCLVFEEAHSLIPEFTSIVGDNDRNAASGTARAILQGRKYGLGCLLITQRTANVTKTILNQCNTIFAFRTFDETGMSFLSNYFGYDYSHILSSIPEQQAVVFGKASSCENPVLIQLNKRGDFTRRHRESFQLPDLPEWTEEQTNGNQAESDEESNNEPDTDDGVPF